MGSDCYYKVMWEGILTKEGMVSGEIRRNIWNVRRNTVEKRREGIVGKYIVLRKR